MVQVLLVLPNVHELAVAHARSFFYINLIITYYAIYATGLSSILVYELPRTKVVVTGNANEDRFLKLN